MAKKPIVPSERAVYHNNRGVKFLSGGDMELAKVEFKTAVELSPDYAEAYNNLGIIAKETGDYKGAKDNFKKAFALDKNYSAAISHLSMVYLDEGNLGKATQYGKLAVKKGPTVPLTHYNLALVYLAQNKKSPRKGLTESAENELKTATELDPNMFDAHLALARLYKEMGRLELSTIRYRLAIENHPFDPMLWMEMSEVYTAMGDNAKAGNALKQAKQISSQLSAEASFNLGLEFYRKGDLPAAEKEWNNTLSINPNHALTLYNMGILYGRQGNADKSSAFFCRFVKTARDEFMAEKKQALKNVGGMGGQCQD